MDCDLPGSSVHGILQARILEWVPSPFSRGSSQTRDQTQACSHCRGFFTSWASREAHFINRCMRDETFLRFLITKIFKLGASIVTICICPQKHVSRNNLPLHICENFSTPRNSHSSLHGPGRGETPIIRNSLAFKPPSSKLSFFLSKGTSKL